MFEFSIDPFGKGRVWVDEPLPITYASKEIYEQITEVETSIYPQSHLLAFELFLLRGTRPTYGLLGATYLSNKSRHLTIKVLSGEGELPDSLPVLAMPPEVVQAGLLKEYTSTILNKALEIQKAKNLLKSGELEFNCAIHGMFTSNAKIFSILSEAVVGGISLLCIENSKDKVVKHLIDLINKNID
jgi:hypothetical protein